MTKEKYTLGRDTVTCPPLPHPLLPPPPERTARSPPTSPLLPRGSKVVIRPTRSALVRHRSFYRCRRAREDCVARSKLLPSQGESHSAVDSEEKPPYFLQGESAILSSLPSPSGGGRPGGKLFLLLLSVSLVLTMAAVCGPSATRQLPTPLLLGPSVYTVGLP